ncbi:MAG: ATP phosphoribosyltransferase regulatory subunit [Pseudomonadota bacterium]|nr:ATP phosphoribosyltransferase regulatory subunit [Pseudomonadota bacterium]MDE3038274.1 ATP phosphoribosyltransferase regulatory subunit [Pseudomonadota bacterium]
MAKTLLPTGCYDLLPPQARQESELSAALLSAFESFGYEQVSPPLLEYSDSLLAGRGAALSQQTFRVMDPLAHKVMGLRPDITLQIARIAASRLSHAARPLRLCYNGLILRMRDEQRHDRQLRQAGIELIGAASPDADAEVIVVAAEALKRAGVTQLTIDLNLPGIVGSLLASEKLDNEQAERLFAAVAHKDISAIKAMSFAYRDSLVGLMQSAGDADKALAAINRLDLPDGARRQCRDLQEVITILRQCSNDRTLTVDATESRGLAYHSGISFSMFVPGATREVGRGGRYRIDGSGAQDTEATGFTLYVETLRGLLPEPQRGKRVFIPEHIGSADAAKLRSEGYVTIYALSEYGRGEDEARRLGCGFIFKDGKVKVLA